MMRFKMTIICCGDGFRFWLFSLIGREVVIIIMMQRQAETHCRWLQKAHTGPEPTHSPQKNVMTCVPSGIFSLPIEKKKKNRV